MATPNAIHNEIIFHLIGAFYPYYFEYRIFGDNMSLVYKGEHTNFEHFELAPCSKYTQKEIDSLNVIVPDFMLFAKDGYKFNKSKARVAGQPLLVIEVWSSGNTKDERTRKKYLYSTSKLTEHWYISQTSDEMECYIGNIKIENQHLTKSVKTNFGLELNLNALALGNRSLK